MIEKTLWSIECLLRRKGSCIDLCLGHCPCSFVMLNDTPSHVGGGTLARAGGPTSIVC